ncbi:MAG TPA: hypothetical protein VGQ09_13785, partial [Chitinophagaceae bacterium]|nr:hypothetical protein [Chitinophagaceae bacterium]
MEQNQNTNEEAQPQPPTAVEVKDFSENIASETSAIIGETKATTLNPLPQAETSIIEPQTETMEVHKHPHHVMHKKNWAEYLLEFFMLFLAVFLGFLVENFREHQVEKERGKGYIESFYEDLKADTARMAFYIDFDDAKLTTLGNLNNCYDTVSKNRKATSCLLELIKISALNRPFKMTMRTLNQLSNAGGFRLLQNEDADSISAYQNDFDNFQDFQATVFQQAQDKVRATFDLLINFKANAQMFKPNGRRIDINFDSKNVTKPLLFSGDTAMLNKYFNELLLYYRTTYNHKERLLELKDNQTRLINYFKNKYRLE